MAKYHINPETGRPNICNPVKTGVCKYGESAPHFDNKDDAREAAEAVLSEVYAPTQAYNKKYEEAYSDLLNRLEGEGDDCGNPYYFFEKNLPNAKILKEIDQIDYRSEYLFEENGHKFLAKFYGGAWSDWDFTGVYKVQEATEDQIEVSLNPVDKLPESTIALIDEFNEIYKRDNTMNAISRFPATTRYSDERYNFGWDIKDKYVQRDDGSRIYGFMLTPPLDSSVGDKPDKVKVDIHLEENGERQNARRFQTGYVIYDERSETGAVFRWSAASEDDTFNEFVIKADGIYPENDLAQDMFTIEGTGESVETPYYRIVY